MRFFIAKCCILEVMEFVLAWKAVCGVIDERWGEDRGMWGEMRGFRS